MTSQGCALPQFAQNFAPETTLALQPLQVFGNMDLPHWAQKRAPGKLTDAHDGHAGPAPAGAG